MENISTQYDSIIVLELVGYSLDEITLFYLSNTCKSLISLRSRLTENLFLQAKQCGNVDVLDWCNCNQQLDKSRRQFSYSVISDPLITLKWMRNNDYDWDTWALIYSITYQRDDVTDWLWEENAPWNEMAALAYSSTNHPRFPTKSK